MRDFRHSAGFAGFFSSVFQSSIFPILAGAGFFSSEFLSGFAKNSRIEIRLYTPTHFNSRISTRKLELGTGRVGSTGTGMTIMTRDRGNPGLDH